MKERAADIFKKLPLVRGYIENRREARERMEKMKADPGAFLNERAREFLRNALTAVAGENEMRNEDIGFRKPLSWANKEQKQKACAQVRIWLEGDYRKTLGQEEIDAAMQRLEARIFGTD